MSCYAVYVEKELVGKRIKSSKVKVLWQFAFAEDFIVHQVELRHSIVSGKREILFDSQPVYANKALFQGTFEHRTKLGGHEIRVCLEDTFEGYLYDLVIDNVMFHRMPRKTLSELETLRAEKKNVPTIETDFASFTGKSSKILDGDGVNTIAKKDTPKPRQEESLIDLDWDSAVTVQPPRPVQQEHQFNPFDTTSFVASQPRNGAYDPFSSQSYPSYAMPSAIHTVNQSFDASFQAAPQNTYYSHAPQQSQQQPYDPFDSFQQPQYQPNQQQYPPHQQYQQSGYQSSTYSPFQ